VEEAAPATTYTSPADTPNQFSFRKHRIRIEIMENPLTA
jgi:hypothetical protein